VSGHRLQRRRQAGISVLLVLLVLALAIGAGAAAAWLVISRVDITLALRDQPLTAIIPQQLEARARVSDNLSLQLAETIRTTVPVDQRVDIPIDDTLNIVAIFKGEIPLKMNVRLRDRIPLQQVIDLNTTVEAYLPELGSTLKIPLRGRIPIDTMVPVDLVIPVDQSVYLDFTTPVTARITQNLNVPLRASIQAEVPIDATFKVPVLNEVEAVINMPTGPSKAVIEHGDLVLPLRTLRLRYVDDAATAP
jgi:hypothetical protein